MIFQIIAEIKPSYKQVKLKNLFKISFIIGLHYYFCEGLHILLT